MSLWQALRARIERAADDYENAMLAVFHELKHLDDVERFAIQEFDSTNNPDMRRCLELIPQGKEEARRALVEYRHAADTARGYLAAVDPDGAGGSVRGLPEPVPVGKFAGGWQEHGGAQVEPTRQPVSDVSRGRMGIYTELGPDGLIELTNMDDGIVGLRMKLMAGAGHATRRHGPDVTVAQLEARAMHKEDPITGTTTDWETGAEHKSSQHATAFTSREALVFAEAVSFGSREVQEARAYSDSLPDGHRFRNLAKAQLPASRVFGTGFRHHVHGRSRTGRAINPTGCVPTQFSNDATIVMMYKRQSPQHEWLPYTCYIKP